MYAVQLNKRDYDLFCKSSKTFPVPPQFGRHTEINGEPFGTTHLYGFRFTRKKDAVRFAVWASAMATSQLDKGFVAKINLLFA